MLEFSSAPTNNFHANHELCKMVRAGLVHHSQNVLLPFVFDKLQDLAVALHEPGVRACLSRILNRKRLQLSTPNKRAVELTPTPDVAVGVSPW